jgi:hypothetical protein
MEWQDIETAPVDVYVRLGRYRDYGNGPVWQTDHGYGRQSVKACSARTDASGRP